MRRRASVAGLLLLIVLGTARTGQGEEAEPKAVQEAQALLASHRASVASKQEVDIATSLAALRALAKRAPADDATRRGWLEVLTLAYETARLRRAPEAARAMLADIDALVMAAEHPEGFRHYSGQALAYAHYELLQRDRLEEARVEREALRALTRVHTGQVILRERLAKVLYTHYCRTDAETQKRIRAELEVLVALPDASAGVRKSVGWVCMRTVGGHLRAGEVVRGLAALTKLRELAQRDESGGANHPLLAALGVAYFQLGEKEPHERARLLLEEARRRIARPAATEAMKDEFAIMLANAIWGAHSARQGKGIPALLGECRTLASRAASTSSQRKHFTRALRNAATHAASQGRGETAETLRAEALALCEKHADDESMRAEYARMLGDVIKAYADRKSGVATRRWLGWLAEVAQRSGATGAELRAYGRALVHAHLQAQRDQPDKSGRLAPLEELKQLAASHPADDHLRFALAQALYNWVLDAGKRRDTAGVGAALADLRTLSSAYAGDEDVALELLYALAEEHKRLIRLDVRHGDAVPLRAELARRTVADGLSDKALGVYADMLRHAHGHLGDARAFDEAERALAALSALAGKAEAGMWVRKALLSAYADKIWDLSEVGRPGDVRATLALARSLHDTSAVGTKEQEAFLLALFRALQWARAAAQAEATTTWMAELASLARADLLGSKAADYHARSLQLDISRCVKAKDLPRAQVLLDALARAAAGDDATPYQRGRWGSALSSVHLGCMRAKEDKLAGRMLGHLYALTRTSPAGGHDGVLALALYNTHWFAVDANRLWEAEVALAELERLAHAEGAHPQVAASLADAHRTHLIAHLEADRLEEARSHLAAIRLLTKRDGAAEDVFDQLAYALYRVHYFVGDAQAYAFMQTLEDELAALASRPTATSTQKDEYADTLADGVWDGGRNNDWKAVDARLAACKKLITREEASAASIAHYARALRNAQETGAGREDLEELDCLGRLRELCDAHPEVSACWRHRAALVRMRAVRAELSDQPGRAQRLFTELRSLCAREEATEAQRDELATHFARLVGIRVRGKRVPEGLGLLEELRALASRPEATPEQRERYLSARGPGALGLLKEGRLDESSRHLAAIEEHVISAGVHDDFLKGYAATLREVIQVRVARGELDAAIALLRSLQVLAGGNHGAVSAARMRFGGVLPIVARLAAAQDRRDEMAPYLVELDSMIGAESESSSLLWQGLLDAREEARKAVRKEAPASK